MQVQQYPITEHVSSIGVKKAITGNSPFFFVITLEPRNESMSLKYDPSSEPLDVSAKELFLS